MTAGQWIPTIIGLTAAGAAFAWGVWLIVRWLRQGSGGDRTPGWLVAVVAFLVVWVVAVVVVLMWELWKTSRRPAPPPAPTRAGAVTQRSETA